MRACGSCGSRVGSDDMYCSFCGIHLVVDSNSEKSMENMIEVISKQFDWFHANRMKDPLVIPTGDAGEHPAVLNLKALKMDQVADKLEGHFRLSEQGQHRMIDIDIVVDCKPVGVGWASTIKLVSGDMDVRMPVFTTSQTLTRNLTKLITMVFSTSFEGLMKERTIPLEIDDL